jgi:DNA-binding protein HU-beta
MTLSPFANYNPRICLLLKTPPQNGGFTLHVLGFSRIHAQQTMAKALSKSQIAASLAETVGLTKKQAVQTMEALVALAYKNAKNSFTIPGLGKIVLVNRKARMGRNPATGETIKIAAKRVVKFRVAKAAKDAILGKK